MMLPPLLKEQVLAQARARPARTRAQGRTRAMVFYGLAFVAAYGLFHAWGGIEHSLGRPLRYTLALALGAVVIALGATRFSAWRGKSLAGLPRAALVAGVLIAPLVTFAWLVAWHGSYVEPFARVGYRCLTQSLVIGGALLLVTLVLRKRSHPTNPVLVGAAIGAAAALWADVFVVLWCPLTNAPHALVGHVLPVVLLSGLGAVLGYKLLAPIMR